VSVSSLVYLLLLLLLLGDVDDNDDDVDCSLLTLELFGLFSLTHVALDAIRQHCTTLRSLNVGQCWRVCLSACR